MKPNRRSYRRWGALLALILIALIALLQGAGPAAQAQSGGSLSYGAKVYGSLSPEAPRATFSFPGAANDLVTITADPWAGALDLRAELIAPNGQVVGSSAQNTRAGEMLGAALSAILPDTGVYLLTITAANEASGDFLLSLAGRPALTGAPLAFGEAVDVSLTPQGAPQYFVFEARDCPTTLTITNLSEGQPFTYPFAARVLDQRGRDVALLRGGEQLEDWVTVAAHSGRYEVEVRSADPAAAGDLRLRVSCAAEAPGCLAGQAALSGVPGAGLAACLPCPGPDDSITGGGCQALNFAVTQDSGDPLRATVTWNPMAAATGYSVYVYGRTPDSGDVYLTHGTWTPGDPTAFTWTLPEGYISFRFELRVYVGETRVCTAETGLSFEIPGEPPPGEQILCQIHTDRADVRARVGPGLGRAAFAFLAPGVNYPVTGFAFDSAGNRWWQIDKTLIPGHEAALSLWVLASEVIGDGMCEQVPPADVPPVIPGIPPAVPREPWTPGEPEEPGGWLPCGSCDTCGHPASECVTSPEGECLWDPATCAEAPPPPDGGEPTPCYAISVTIDMSKCQYTPGSAMLDVAPNCDGGYLPGTAMAAHAVAVDPKCNVEYWSGCGVSSGENSVTFTATGSCVLTAHMHYGG